MIRGEYFQALAETRERLDNCKRIYSQLGSFNCKEPSPMWIRESETYVHWNWTAIFSYTASLAVSLAIWRGLFLAVGRFVR